MKPQLHCRRSKGFALVVTLSLMILLTILAVGLLTISSISLRASSQDQAVAQARANARLAMMMALGELQKTAGPDRRVTAPANLAKATHPEGLAGVWKSWRPAPSGVADQDYVNAKKGDGFLGYLMSNPDPAAALDPQTLPVPSALGSTPLVSTGSLGDNLTNREISAPLMRIKGGTAATAGQPGSIAWTVLDEGVKSRIDLPPAEEPAGMGDSITQAGTPARNRFIKVDGMGFLDEPAASLRDSLPKLVTLNETQLMASSQDAVQRLFNDFTVNSSSLQVDVANGGLKTDLSVLFDEQYGATLPAGYSGRYLYSDETTPFQNATSDSLWELYANHARLYRRTTASDNPRDGLKATLSVATRPPSYLKAINDATLKKPRYEPDMSKVKRPVLMPTVARVDMVFSLVARGNHTDTRGGQYNYLLHLMYLPVITLHNPYSVPLRCTNLQVEFANVPIGFQFLINDQPTPTSGLAAFKEMYIWGLGRDKVFNMTLSTSLDSATEVVMKPGETRLFGTPYPKDMTFQRDLNGERKMHDWASNLTGAARLVPGLMTGPNDGAGFDLDHLVPDLYNRSTEHKARWDNPVLPLLPTDRIAVRYGPLIPDNASNTFAITVRLNGTEAARTQFFYANETKLKAIMEEGTSPRFPEPRSFPALFPAAGASPITTLSIYEANTTQVRNYAKARPFAIFSVGAKTTVESFTQSRPVADTGTAFQMATCDFVNSTSQGTNPLEFAFVPVKNGSAAIESGGPRNEQGFLFGGNGSLHGEISATIYEIPMAPLQSIAQLRHANGGSTGSVPYVTYTVGESRAHPALPSNAAFFKVDSSRTVLDHSWLANDRLWDGYWFSTLSTLQGTAYTGASSMTQKELAGQFFAGTGSLPNKRNIAYQPPGKSATDASTDALTVDGRKSAAHIMTQGGFNVNSTSVPAWIAILSGLSESDIPLATGATERSTGAPFLRVRRPAAANNTFDPKEKLWNGFRSLTPDEIGKLAEEIVAEVRTRGPFLSMSEFVNRRLGSAGSLSNAGAIQAALDRSNVNANMVFNAREIAPAEVAGYGWMNPGAVTGNTGAGAPGEVTQGDVLSAIGSFVSVRSDTFRIRSYGDARDAAGRITARAYCEAIVQRIPDYLDPAESADAIPLGPANLLFGRRFMIVSFRWLSPAEI
jgi:type II secretory pathway pseudopilin PulG